MSASADPAFQAPPVSLTEIATNIGARLAKVFQDHDKAAEYGLQLRRLYPGTPEYQQFLAEQK